MEKLKSKILDNTFISLCISDITSVDLLEILNPFYYLTTSHDVYEETLKGFDVGVVEKAYQKIRLANIDNSKYNDILNWLEARFPYLHKGELSSFLLALLEYEIIDKKYCYITDDKKMRKTVKEKVFNELFLLEKLPKKIINFNMIGSIGLIKKIYDNKIIDNVIKANIKNDLRNSSFYLSPKLLDEI